MRTSRISLRVTRLAPTFEAAALFIFAGTTAIPSSRATAADKTIRALCEDKFRDFHHGLKLIARDGDQRRFSISREVVDAPDQVLSRWVVERFRAEGDPPGQR